jgi:hypothetical protein
MKKNYLLGFFALATMLFTASCQEENLVGTSGDTAMVTFEVSTPTISTRTVGDGKTAKKLYVGVYENQNGTLAGPLEVSLIDEGETVTFTDRVAKVNLALAKNKEYSVIFWAETENNAEAMFDINWGDRELNLKSSLKANQEKYDAFWAQKTVTLTGALTETVELKRPFAQLNIGTSDKVDAEAAGIVVTQSQVVVKKVPTTFNLQTGAVSNEQEVTYTMASIEGIKNENFPAVAAGQQYLSLNYLPMAVDKSIVDIEFKYKDEQDNDAYVLNFPSVPVQRNFRTNIYGTLLTNSANYTVEIKPGFGNDGEEDVANIVYASTAEELQAALNAAAEDSTIKVVLLNDITLNGQTAAYTTNAKNVIIESNGAATTRSGNSKKFTLTFKDSYRTYFGLDNKDAKVTFNNVNIHRETTGGTHWHDNNMKFTCNAEFNNVDFNKGICFDNAKTFVMNNCSINKGKVATYALFITAGCDVTIDGLSVTHSEGVAGRGIKIVDEDVENKDALTTLSVSNATFVTEAKAAILVGSQGGADITLSNLDLSGVKADQFNAVWVDEDYKDYADEVAVEGGFKAVEGDKAATDAANPFLVENATVPVAKGVYSALPKVANGVTIEAEEGTVFTGTSSVSGKNVTIKNVTFKGDEKALTGNLDGTTFENCQFNATYGAQWCYAYGDVTFTNCVFGSETSKRGIHFDGGDGNVTFESCTFYAFNALGQSNKKYTFNNCDIKVSSKALNGFNGVNMYGTTYEYNSCRFEPGTYTDCAANNVAASYTDCSYTDGKSIYSIVRFDKDPATCTITFDGKQMVYNTAHLAKVAEKLASDETTEVTLLLAESTFVIPASVKTQNGGTIIIEGLGNNSVLQFNSTPSGTDGGLNSYADGMDLVFKKLKVVSPNTGSPYTGGFGRSKSVAFEGCTYEGQFRSMSPVTFTGCTIDPMTSYIYTDYSDATFTGCTFNCSEGKGIQVYNDGNSTNTTINVENCTFTAAKVGNTWDGKPVTAIDINSNGEKFTVNIINTTATGFGTGLFSNNQLWNIKGGEANVTVTIDNNVAYPFFTQDETTGDYTVTTVQGLKDVLTSAGLAGAGNSTINIASNIDLTGVEWTPIKVDGYHGADIVTVNGNGKTITGLTGGLFAGGFAGGSGIVIKNLTIANSTIIANNTQGYGAFVGCADAMDEITLINCHLKNSTIITPNGGADESRIGGLIGWTAGYNNQNDGPVDSYITVQNCSVTGCTLKGAGSIGGIVGHAGANAATFTTIENCTVTDNYLISTDAGAWRVGVVVGTANNGQCVINNITESNNTLSQTDKTAPAGQSNLYGRFVPAGTGTLVIDGVNL